MPISLVLVASACSLGQVALGATPGTGVFEPWIQQLWAEEGHPSAQATVSSAAGVELRVAKGLGSKGYGKVRVSVVSPKLDDVADFNFTYRKQFKHRWTERNFLHSSLLDLSPGANKLTIGGHTVVVDLPPEDMGIRGIMWSDPCFSSKWIHCAYADRFQTFNRSLAMLNTVFQDPSMDLFAILGDNFYDQTGELTKTFFARLSPEVKRRFMFVVNGNHDNWVCGGPECGDQHDNFGIGQMQYYPADPVASVLAPQNDTYFMDLSVDPDAEHRWNTFQNAGTNFLVYHKLGNIGFLGFSGASDFKDMKPHFQEACQYFEQSKPAVVFLLGHWNSDGMGCSAGMTVPELRAELLQIEGCSALGDRLKYMDGHEHCNYVQQKGIVEPVGFMIGAHGMDDQCAAQFGFLFLDSTASRVKIHYFEVDGDARGDRFQDILTCVQSQGSLAACTHLADTWLDVPTTVTQDGLAEWVV